jgi:hypothetical protein
VREAIFDRLTPEQVTQLRQICGVILSGLPMERRGKALMHAIMEHEQLRDD